MKKNKINVRLAKEEDIDYIVKFNKEMAFETEGIILSYPKLKDGVTAVFKDKNKGFYLVAEIDGNLVGQALITSEWSDWRNAFFWWIQSVYVVPEHRRSGVLRSIFDQIRSISEQNSNVCGLRLYVEKNNFIAKKAYENLRMYESHYDLYEMML
ncbi:MAG: GNAT family N-acetyltransferase [bacterium]